MSLTKQYTVTVDTISTKQASNSINFNILDENVYSVVLTIQENGVDLDLTPYTVGVLLNNTPLANTTVTNAITGEVTILFNDVSTFEASKTFQTVIRLTEGSVVRHYHGFNFATSTLP